MKENKREHYVEIQYAEIANLCQILVKSCTALVRDGAVWKERVPEGFPCTVLLNFVDRGFSVCGKHPAKPERCPVFQLLTKKSDCVERRCGNFAGNGFWKKVPEGTIWGLFLPKRDYL